MAMAEIEPYSFEPMRDHSDSDEDLTENPDESRRGNTAWCSCERCENWSNQQERECLCCREMEEAVTKMSDFETDHHPVRCITQHSSFSMICLQQEVLETAIVGLSQARGTRAPREMNNTNYRYAAYRQFTWWVHDRLGRYVRKVIPACAVKEIREAYPDADGNYTGFRAASDESYSEVDLSWIQEIV